MDVPMEQKYVYIMDHMRIPWNKAPINNGELVYSKEFGSNSLFHESILNETIIEVLFELLGQTTVAY